MVIDASIGFKWVVPEEGSAEAVRLLENSNLLVPTLFHAEVGNALWKKVRRNEIAFEPLLPFFSNLPELVQTVAEAPFVARAAELAVELDHPIYDCVYLATAEALEDELLTADLRFLRVVADSPYRDRVRRM
jgi:predicted nucleic acid-binding protein